ncbi:hypothetical protein ABPG73_008991 [Tetrahymena malaccensis]
MESQSESNNKLIQDKQSIFFQNSQIEEAKSSQFNETLVDRSRQRYLFEQQNNKLQQSHRGDSEIQESSMQDGIITTFEMKQLISTERRSLQTNCWDEINSKMCKDNQSINEQVIQVQIENDSCSQQEMKQDFSKIESMIINDQQEQQQPQNLEQNNTQNINLQDKSIIAASQNAPIKESQIYQPINQINEEKLCIKNENEKEIWFQEDIFYEKNLKKLGTKVTFQLKGQYQIQQDNNRLSKYKQNFLKATNIINRLLNNSVSRVVKIRQHVQNFVNILKLRHFNRKLDELNENDFISINDLSHFYFPNDKKKQNYQNSSLIYNIERLSKLLPVFMPTDLARVIWDMIQVLYTYLFLYIYSIFIFFDQHDFKSQLMQKLCLYSFINYLADIIINLNTAIFNKDNIIDRRKLIAKQYFLSTIFVTDFLSMTVLISKLFNFRELTLQNQNYNFFKCVFNILIFLKVNGISEKKKRFDYIITLTENQKHVIKLINQIASVMTVAHIAAIGWYFLGIQEIQSNQNNWLDKLDISDHQYYEKYIYSIYWAITTMTTAHEQKDRDKQAEDQILSVLSNKLREEITIEINSKILNSYFVLSSNFSQATLSKVIFIMEEVLVNPNEVIISEQEYDDSSIYFIQSGIIEIYQHQIQKQKKVNVIKVLKNGSIFGELSFFSGFKRQASARSVNLSTLYKIRRDQFIEILKENTEDFERFKMMQDQIIFQSELSAIHVECFNCKNIGHIATKCPRIQRTKDQQLVILRQNYSIFQERAQTKRKRNKHLSYAYKLLKQNQEICNFLKHNLKEQNYEYYDMFETNEHLFTSEDTQSKFQNDEDDEDSISQITYNFDEQSMDVNSQAINRAQKRKKANVFMKGMKKTNNFSTQNIEDNESILSQEKHSQNTKSNSYQENQDYIKAASNFSGFQIKTMSFEAQDNLNIKQDHQKKENFFSQQCKALHKLETDPNNQSITEISNQQSSLEEEEISIINGSKKSGSQKQIQSSFNIINQHQYDIDKKQFKKLSSNNHLNIQYSKQISHQSIDDQNLNKNKNGQLIKQDTIDNLNKQQCFHKPISPDQNQNKQLNQKEVKHLIDQILLQNIILNNFLHDNKLPQLQQLNILNNACSIQDLIDKNPIQNTFDKRIKSIKEENFVKHTSSVRSNRDIKEKRSSLISQHSNYFNNQNRRDDKSNLSSNNYEILQNCIKNKDTCQANKINLISGVSNVLENAQIPLNLQINNNQSYLQSESEDLPITIESFDKIQFFKKYFPHNNFEKVMQKLKQYQSEQKKIKKNKLASKQRRQNIGFSNNVILSMFQGNSNLIKFIPQDYNINLYKPTYLSYGVKMQKGNKFPKNFYTQEKNNS